VKRSSIFILLAILAVACQEPLSTEQFIPGGGPYVFTVDLSDTTAAYDFDLYTRLDGDPEDLIPVKGTLLRAEWRSPSDSVFVEKIYLPLTGTRQSFFSRQVYEPYRADVRPVQPGQWTLTFRQEDRSQVVPFRGLGLVVRRNPSVISSEAHPVISSEVEKSIWDTEN